MNVFRVYPEKSTTIASGYFANNNSGQNAITELWYGGGGVESEFPKRHSISRFLVKFDLTDLQSKISSQIINEDLVSSYKLIMKNSIPSDLALEPEYDFTQLDKAVASSFDLICFPIDKDWDEGRGYDMMKEVYVVKQKGNPLITGASNWNLATLTTSWNENGIYTNPSASTSGYASQHFALGDENIEFDVTNMVQDWLSGGSTNYGFGIGYRRDFELITSDTRYISSFYTEKTNTAFKPYLQVEYNQTIIDDRKQVSNNRPSKLFFYAFSGHNFTNIAVLSGVTVDIKRGSTNIYTGLTPTQLTKGVYYVNVWMSGGTPGQLYTDTWNNIQFTPPYDNQNISQNFQIQKNFYTSTKPTINEYVIDVYGIENNSIVNQNENIRLFCDLRVNYSVKNPETAYSLEYKLTMNNQLTVIDWTSTNRVVWDGCIRNYLDIDASWLLHNQTYQINFRINEMGTSRIMPEKVNFKVLRDFS